MSQAAAQPGAASKKKEKAPHPLQCRRGHKRPRSKSLAPVHEEFEEEEVDAKKPKLQLKASDTQQAKEERMRKLPLMVDNIMAACGAIFVCEGNSAEALATFSFQGTYDENIRAMQFAKQIYNSAISGAENIAKNTLTAASLAAAAAASP